MRSLMGVMPLDGPHPCTVACFSASLGVLERMERKKGRQKETERFRVALARYLSGSLGDYYFFHIFFLSLFVRLPLPGQWDLVRGILTSVFFCLFWVVGERDAWS